MRRESSKHLYEVEPPACQDLRQETPPAPLLAVCYTIFYTIEISPLEGNPLYWNMGSFFGGDVIVKLGLLGTAFLAGEWFQDAVFVLYKKNMEHW